MHQTIFSGYFCFQRHNSLQSTGCCCISWLQDIMKSWEEDWVRRQDLVKWEITCFNNKGFLFPLVVLEAINRSPIRNDIIAIKFSFPELFPREKNTNFPDSPSKQQQQLVSFQCLHWPLRDNPFLIRLGDQGIFPLRLKIFRLRTRNIFIRFNCDWSETWQSGHLIEKWRGRVPRWETIWTKHTNLLIIPVQT